jgi:hypothetical protein
MRRLPPEELKRLTESQFPPQTTCWSQATDEVRDMCRAAREMAGVAEELAVDFQSLNTPSAWNSEGIAGMIKFYSMLNNDQQREFCHRFGRFLRQQP